VRIAADENRNRIGDFEVVVPSFATPQVSLFFAVVLDGIRILKSILLATELARTIADVVEYLSCLFR